MQTAETELRRLLDIMAALRAPVTGCPWDQVQTYATIAPYTIEEAYEVADAITRRDFTDLPDELGDLLFQVVFHARMAEEEGRFAFADVARSIADKMLRRHPHVFAEAEIRNASAQTEAWEAQKRRERAAKAQAGVLAGIPVALPALTRAQKLAARAARVGFDWPDAAAVLEVGDMLFVLVNLARKLDLDAEACLRHANAKFERRFNAVEALFAAEGRGLAETTLQEMDAAWDAVKQTEVKS